MADEPTVSGATETDANTLALAQGKLAELLDQLKVKAEVIATWGDLDPEDQTRPLTLDVQGEDLNRLIGRNG